MEKYNNDSNEYKYFLEIKQQLLHWEDPRAVRLFLPLRESPGNHAHPQWKVKFNGLILDFVHSLPGYKCENSKFGGFRSSHYLISVDKKFCGDAVSFQDKLDELEANFFERKLEDESHFKIRW